tara:strand:- start:219 stop:407 length:189 start_codon:yes stop_codon:yes gene_type:complete
MVSAAFAAVIPVIEPAATHTAANLAILDRILMVYLLIVDELPYLKLPILTARQTDELRWCPL